MLRLPPRSTRTDTLFPYTTLFRSLPVQAGRDEEIDDQPVAGLPPDALAMLGVGLHAGADAAPEIVEVRREAAVRARHQRHHVGKAARLRSLVGEHLVDVRAFVKVRSEERREGKGGVSTCRSRWSQYN